MKPKTQTHIAALALAALLPVSLARASLYTWSAADGNFSDPANWLNSLAPTPAGSPTDQLLFPSPPNDPTEGYTITFDNPTPYRLNALTFSSTFNSGITLQNNSSNPLIFDGPNPTITAAAATSSFNPDTITGPISTTSNLTLTTTPGGGLTIIPVISTGPTISSLTFSSGNLLLTGPLTSTGSQSSLIISGGITATYQNNTAPTGFSQTVIGPPPDSSNTISHLIWSYAPADSTPVSLSFGSGPIILTSANLNPNSDTGGSFGILLTAPAVSSSQTPLSSTAIAPSLAPADVSTTIASLAAQLEALEGLLVNSPTLSFPITRISSLPVITIPPPTTYLPVSVDITNPIIIQGSGALAAGLARTPSTLPYNLAPSNLPIPPTATVRYTGPVQLNGSLLLTDTPTYSGLTTTLNIAGPITLDQSHNLQPQISANGNYTDVLQVIVSGNITDAAPPTPASQPLLLQGPEDGSESFTLSGTNNTYAIGTIIDNGAIVVAPTSSLGTGNVAVNFATLHLSAPTNLAPGRTVLLNYIYSTLALSFDQNPVPLLDPKSIGVLALDTTFTTPLDLSKLGNGQMSLGTTNNGIYAATTLAPAADHIYRFTIPTVGNYSTAQLTLLHSVLVDYNNIPTSAQLAYVTLAASNTYSGGSLITGPVYANAPGTLGTGDVTVGSPLYAPADATPLYISTPNAYSPTAHVNVFTELALIGSNGSISPNSLPPTFQPGSILVLGDNTTNNSDRYPDAFPLPLNSVTLHLKGYATTAETVGPLTISGASTIVLENPATGSTNTTLLAPTLTLAPHSALLIVPVNTSFDPTAASTANVQIAAAPTVTNGIVSPAIQTRPEYYINFENFSPSPPPIASFLSYSSAGFAPPTYSPMPTTGGTGIEVVDVVDPVAFTLNQNTSIYALRTAANIPNPTTGPITLHITSGGLITQPDTFSSITLEPDIDFAAAEAFINVADYQFYSDTPTILTGIVTASAGLTKFGLGTLQLTNPNNQIHGPITLLEGSLQLANLSDPNSSTPITLAEGTTLTFTNSINLTQPLHLVAGAPLDANPTISISVSTGQTLTISVPINNQFSTNLIGGNLIINAPITLANGLFLSADAVHIAAPISCTYLDLYGHVTGSATITTSQGILFSNGKISPGDNPGDIAALTIIGSLSFQDAAILDLDLDSAGNCDQLLLTGDLDLPVNDPSDDPSPELDLNFLSPPTGQTYTLLSALSITGTFSVITGLPNNYTLDYSHPGFLLLEPTIPEPATFTLLTLALLPTLRKPRRKLSPN